MVNIPTPITETTAGAAKLAKQGVVEGTRMSLSALQNTLSGPVVTEAAKGAVQLGITSLSILGLIGLFGSGFMTVLGKPPQWMKNTILPS